MFTAWLHFLFFTTRFYSPDKHAYIRLIGFFVTRIEKFKHDFTNALSARANRRVVPVFQGCSIVDGHPRGRLRRVGIPIHEVGRKRVSVSRKNNSCAPFQLTRRDKSWKRGDSTRLERGYRPSFVNKTIREYRKGGEEGGPF